MRTHACSGTTWVLLQHNTLSARVRVRASANTLGVFQTKLRRVYVHATPRRFGGSKQKSQFSRKSQTTWLSRPRSHLVPHPLIMTTTMVMGWGGSRPRLATSTFQFWTVCTVPTTATGFVPARLSVLDVKPKRVPLFTPVLIRQRSPSSSFLRRSRAHRPPVMRTQNAVSVSPP